MFSKTISRAALLLSLFISKNIAVPDDKIMYYDIKNLSLHPPYITEGLRSVDWSFGNATVMEINNYIRLTPNLPSKQGWLWSKVPLISNNWEIEFEYKIHGNNKDGSSGNKNSNNGDGFAFFFSPERAIEGDAFGNIQNFKGLGIFFDTFANSKHGYLFPRISGMVGDGKLLYNIDNDGEDILNESEACSLKIREQNKPTKARIVYIKNNYVEVSLTNDENPDYIHCFTISKPDLPKSGYLGFTASTGEAVDNHDIISVSTKGILDKFVGKTGQRKVVKNPSNEFEVVEEREQGWKTPVLIIGFILGVCGVAMYTLRTTSHKQYFDSRSHKHFGHFN